MPSAGFNSGSLIKTPGPGLSSPTVPGGIGGTSGGAKGSGTASQGSQGAPSAVKNHWFAIASNRNTSIPGSAIPPQSLYLSDNFFRWAALDGADARRSYNYEFVIVKLDPKGNDQELVDKIVFPLNPQTISISVPPAIITTVTAKGINEEHNGAPLRSISLQGTSGIMPSMPLVRPQGTSTDLLGFLFKNTIKSAGNVIAQASKLISAFSQGTGPQYTNLLAAKPSEYSGFDNLSGYHFIHSLFRFFDYYLALKKRADAKQYRLVFHMHKDKMYYNVSLGPHSLHKPQGSLEYNYQIQLTAWGRRETPAMTSRQVKTVDLSFAPRGLGDKIQNAINQIRQARKVVASAYGVMSGIRSDIQESFINPLREIVLLGKDTANLTLTMLDFAGLSSDDNGVPSLWQGLGAAWRESLADQGGSGSAYMNSTRSAMLSAGYADSNASGAKSDLDSFASDASSVSGGTQSEFSDQNSSPVMNVLQNPAAHPDIFDNEELPIDNLPLAPLTQELLTDEVDRVSRLLPDDLRTRRDRMSDFASSISEALGGGSSSYNRVNGRPAPKRVFKALTTQDIEVLGALNDILMGTDALIASLENSSPVRDNDYFEFYRDFALNAGLDFTQSLSKFYVPFPYGASLESLAVQYLGDANRWIEIAAINGLKAPYIDEDGFEIPLIASASGDSATIAQAQNLYVGQIVKVLSDALPSVTRKIRSIDVVSSVEVVVTFESISGQSLSGFKLNDNARIHAFMPDTVNSLKLIAIPSSNPANIDSRIKVGAGVDDLNGLARIAKTDILLDTNGDWVISSGGDIKFATGLTNLTQAAMIILRTKIGELVQLPNFGGGSEAGESSADLNANDILASLNSAFAQDSRFTGIIAAEVEKKGVTASVKILLGVSGQDTYLPLEAVIPV